MILKEEGTSFTPAPADTHVAVCVDFADLGTYDDVWQGETKRSPKCRLVFEIDATRPEDGKRYIVSTMMTASLSEKANLRKFLNQWRGRPFADEELKGFDTERLIGAPALLSVIHKVKGDKTYANISSAVPLPRAMASAKLAPAGDYVRVKDRSLEDQIKTGVKPPALPGSTTAPTDEFDGFPPPLDDEGDDYEPF